MKPIKIALIGVNENSHSVQIHSRISSLTEYFQVAGIVFPENEKERLPKTAGKFAHLPELTLAEVLLDPTIEAVAIETDEIYCTKYALLAAKAGKHIHMEKPGGRELGDFENLIATVKEHSLIFCPGYMYRYNPYIRELMASIEQGDLGKITSVEAQMSCTHSVAARNFLGQFPGGMLFFLGCHLIDLIYRIQGQPLKVHALSRSVGTDGVKSCDYGMTVLEYEHGISFARCVSTELGGFRRRQIVVTGTKGTVELKPLEWGPEAAITTRRNISTDRKWQNPGIDTVSDPFDRYIPMLTHFARCVRGEIQNEFTPDYELELYKLLLRCCSSKVLPDNL